MTTTTEHAPSMMDRLKASTADLHRHAENRVLQRSLAKGTLPRETYAAYLAQMYLVHRALEGHLCRLRDLDTAFATAFQDDQRRVPNLLEDLEYFGIEPDTIEPLAATTALVQAIDQTAAAQPIALLGMLYVLEGSNNGSKYIARALSRAYSLPSGPGLSYFDPYGEHQMQRWQTFKADMNAIEFTEPQMHSIIDAAQVMFNGIADISDELMQPANA